MLLICLLGLTVLLPLCLLLDFGLGNLYRLPVHNTSRVRVREPPPLEPFDASECAWSAPAQHFVGGSPRVAVCLAGAFRTVVSPVVYGNIRRQIDSFSPNTHVFAVGQLGNEMGTGPHVHGQRIGVDVTTLRPVWQALRPQCVKFDEQPPPCDESSCTGQWNKWTACARTILAFAAQRGIEYDRVVKLRFDMMFRADYPSLDALGVFRQPWTTHMDHDFVIVWPWVMVGAVANMSYTAECTMDVRRCPLIDYRRTRPSCTCLAKAFFEDVGARLLGYPSFAAY
eukprot:7382059-Prymnesium_polylepis.1